MSFQLIKLRVFATSVLGTFWKGFTGRVEFNTGDDCSQQSVQRVQTRCCCQSNCKSPEEENVKKIQKIENFWHLASIWMRGSSSSSQSSLFLHKKYCAYTCTWHVPHTLNKTESLYCYFYPTLIFLLCVLQSVTCYHITFSESTSEKNSIFVCRFFFFF